MHVGILVYHHVDEYQVVTPLSLLAAAGRLLPASADGSPVVEVATVARSRFSVQTSGGLTLTPAWAFASAPEFDALVVPGGPGVERASRDAALSSFFATRVPGIARLLSIGSGALILGVNGLLRNQRVAAPEMLHEQLEAFEIVGAVGLGLVHNPRIWCAATAGDASAAAEALVADRFGSDEARVVADAWWGRSSPGRGDQP